MKKYSANVLAVFVMVFLLSFCNEVVIPDYTDVPEIDTTETTIFFIGNSGTYYNNMPDMFYGLAETGGKNLYVRQSTFPDATLAQHLDDYITTQYLTAIVWDFVILQGSHYEYVDSTIHYVNYDDHYSMQEKIRVRSPEATFVFQMGHVGNVDARYPDSAHIYFDYVDRVIRGSETFAHEMDYVLSPFGAACRRLHLERPEVELWVSENDGHNSVEASYLQACVFYATLFKEPISDNPYYSVLREELATYLQRIASETVLNNLDRWNNGSD